MWKWYFNIWDLGYRLKFVWQRVLAYHTACNREVWTFSSLGILMKGYVYKSPLPHNNLPLTLSDPTLWYIYIYIEFCGFPLFLLILTTTKCDNVCGRILSNATSKRQEGAKMKIINMIYANSNISFLCYLYLISLRSQNYFLNNVVHKISFS